MPRVARIGPSSASVILRVEKIRSAFIGLLYFRLFYAFALWIYYTLDNIDGKQARRTGSSSPLGELCLGVIIQSKAFALSSIYLVLLLLIACLTFFITTWERLLYHLLKASFKQL